MTITVPTLALVLPILGVVMFAWYRFVTWFMETRVRPRVQRALIARYGSCTCPDDESGPWDPDWDGEIAIDRACPYHGGRS